MKRRPSSMIRNLLLAGIALSASGAILAGGLFVQKHELTSQAGRLLYRVGYIPDRSISTTDAFNWTPPRGKPYCRPFPVYGPIYSAREIASMPANFGGKVSERRELHWLEMREAVSLVLKRLGVPTEAAAIPDGTRCYAAVTLRYASTSGSWDIDKTARMSSFEDYPEVFYSVPTASAVVIILTKEGSGPVRLRRNPGAF